jgi:hypothetical protein
MLGILDLREQLAGNGSNAATVVLLCLVKLQLSVSKGTGGETTRQPETLLICCGDDGMHRSNLTFEVGCHGVE